MKKLIGAALLSLVTTQAFGCGQQKEFLPENNLEIPATVKHGGLSRDEYHRVIDKVEQTYSPIAAKFGAKIVMERLWDNPRVNAGTIRAQRGKIWKINLYGGFPRHPLVTPDGYALVICHEIGHHIGGAPKKSPQSAPWSSNEGQADYFATLKCLRKVFADDDHAEIIKNMNIPGKVTTACSSALEKDLCIRTSMAGLAIASVSADVRKVPTPSFDSPDKNEVLETVEKHPMPQCRLDTYFQGSICHVSKDEDVSQTDPLIGTCHEASGHKEGVRPGCWFNPWENK